MRKWINDLLMGIAGFSGFARLFLSDITGESALQQEHEQRQAKCREARDRWVQTEQLTIGSAPIWHAIGVPAGIGRVDIFGGGHDRAWGWEALLSVYGTSAVGTRPPAVVLDLNGRELAHELCLPARATPHPEDTQTR